MSQACKIAEYIRDYYSAEPEHLWTRTPEYAVFRHKSNGKWFAALMPGLSKKTLGLGGESSVDIINLKCDPLLKGSLIDGRGILPGYHMNKEHWISIVLDGAVPFDEICRLLELSYKITLKKHR